MPIPSANFGLTDVRNEFGINTRPANHSLGAFHTAIFGSAGAGSKLSNFANYGKPSVTNFSTSTSTTDGGYIDVDFDINPNNLNSTVIVQYQENDGTVPDEADWLDGDTNIYSTGGNKSLQLQLPKTSQSYHIRLTYYNDFNNGHENDYLHTPSDIVTSSGASQLTTPTLSGTVEYTGGGEGYITFTYSDDEDNFIVETRVDGSSASTSIECTKNVGTTNSSKEIRVTFGQLPQNSVEFRVKATSTNIQDSNFSQWTSATNTFSVPSCPL